MTKEFFISDKSEKLKFLRLLENDPLTRKEHKQCLVFGEKTVLELKNIHAFITTEARKDEAIFQNHDRYILSEKSFKNLSGLISPDFVGAIVNLDLPSFPKTLKKGVVILDVINDPGNLGTIFRTCYGLDLDGIILIKNSCDPLHSKVIRASKGVCLKLPFQVLERQQIDPFIKTYQLKSYCADLSGRPLSEIHNTKPFALILGNESQGISNELKKLGEQIHIPQKDLESYNVAIACAIMSYTLSSGWTS